MNKRSPPLIAHVIHHLVIGGMENGLVNLINRMPRSHFRHVVICIEDFSEFRNRIEREDVDVIALYRSTTGVWQLRRSLFGLFRALRPTVVHSRNLSGLDALVPAWLARVPAIIHGEHGWDVSDLDGSSRRTIMLRRIHAPFVDRYVTVSKHLKDYLIERIGVDARKVMHICNGVDTERFAPGGSDRRARYPASLFNEKSFVIGTVGRLQPVKDQLTLIRAIAALFAVAPSLRSRVRLAIVGDGPSRGMLEDLAAEGGISDVTWFAGATDSVPDFLRGMDLFVLPSLNEGISNTILEAMATGLPVVATDVGGNPELVEPGVTGYLFRPGDVGALTQFIGQLVVDDVLRTISAHAALAAARSKFGLDVMMQRYSALYGEFSDGSSQTGATRC